MSRYLGLAAAMGAIFALSGAAIAGDDTVRLDLKKSSKVTLTGAGSGTSEFSHDSRAKASDEEVEDVFYGYRRGYNRGYYGGSYIVPRFYPYRAGYWNGIYARSSFYPAYYYSSYYYPAVRYYYPPVQTYYYSAPVVTYVDPCGGAGANVAATNTLQIPSRMPSPRQMPRSNEPLPSAPRTKPMEPVYPYDGPVDAGQNGQGYRYDGGPANPVPMPPADLNPSGSAMPRADQADGRVVKLMPTAKKPTYQAYGDNRRKSESSSDRTVVVKKTNE